MQIYRDFEIEKVGNEWHYKHQFFRGYGTSGIATSLAGAYGMIEDWYGEDDEYEDSPYADGDEYDY